MSRKILTKLAVALAVVGLFAAPHLDASLGLENYKPRTGMFPNSPDAGVNNTPHFGVSKIRNPKGLSKGRIGDRKSVLNLKGDSVNIYDRDASSLYSPAVQSAREAVEKFLRSE